MIRPDELLRTILEALRRGSGAARAVLYLPSSSVPAREPFLASVGEGPKVPELADLHVASRLEELVGAEPGGGAGHPWSHHPSRDDATLLLRLPPLERLVDLFDAPNRADDRRTNGETRHELWRGGSSWLGLRFPEADERVAELRDTLAGEAVSLSAGAARPLPWLLTLVGTLAGQAHLLLELLHDPTSRLLGRSDLQRLLGEALGQARRDGGTVALLLVNPDDFATVNERHGRGMGDRVVREIAERLARGVRKTDLVGRYGGVVFAVILGGVRAQEALSVARKLAEALEEHPYGASGIALRFSLGIVEWDPESSAADAQAAIELLLRADRALSAAKSGERERIALWDPDLADVAGEPVDRLQGIFTGDVGRDYRNMLILWDTVAATTTSPSFGDLAARLCERLTSALGLERVAVVVREEGSDLRLVAQAGRGAAPGGAVDRSFEQALGAEPARLVGETVDAAEAREGPVHPPGSEEPCRGLALPLVESGRCTGALYLERSGERAGQDLSDNVFLQALAAQLAAAQERARLIQEAARLRERDRRQVRTELAQLRPLLGSDRLVYRSSAMEEILATARQVADSDATVLITGESGTGKELVARTLHSISGRRDKPLVVVDCTTLAPSLLESELFGHERGAFTGADRSSAGRLGEVAGGTLVLDEIGELPSEGQSRLLRVVQEKAYTPVGGSRPRSLDARIVAVTNRDLRAEVAAGRFREDLFYRLNVLRLALPSLRRRPEDIEFLAAHFLERFAHQHGRPVPPLSDEARAALRAHDWPGNVRELQNRVLRAVLLSRAGALQPEDLGLGEDGSEDHRAVRLEPSDAELVGRPAAAPDPWSALAAELGRQVADALDGGAARARPLGRWLADDLALAAERCSGGGTHRRGGAPRPPRDDLPPAGRQGARRPGGRDATARLVGADRSPRRGGRPRRPARRFRQPVPRPGPPPRRGPRPRTRRVLRRGRVDGRDPTDLRQVGQAGGGLTFGPGCRGQRLALLRGRRRGRRVEEQLDELEAGHLRRAGLPSVTPGGWNSGAVSRIPRFR